MLAEMAHIKIHSLSEDFLRQRRNVIISSLGLSLFYVGEGTISKNQSFSLGIEFGNPEVLIVAAWLSWLYFIWRFIIYSNTAIEKYVSCYLQSFKAKNLHILCLNILKWEKRRSANKNTTPSDDYFRRVQNGCFPTISLGFKGFVLDFNKDRSTFVYRTPSLASRDARVLQDIEKTTVILPYNNEMFFPLLRGVISCFFNSLFKEQGFSDLVVPYLLFIFALSIGIYEYWPDNLLSFLISKT